MVLLADDCQLLGGGFRHAIKLGLFVVLENLVLTYEVDVRHRTEVLEDVVHATLGGADAGPVRPRRGRR